MNLSSLATIANLAPPNLLHFVLNNGALRGKRKLSDTGRGKNQFRRVGA